MSDQLQMFGEQTSQESTSSLWKSLPRFLIGWKSQGSGKETEAVLSLKQYGLSENADQEFLFGKMLKEHSPQTMGQTFAAILQAFVDIGGYRLNGNCLTQVGFYPKTESGYTLSDILQKPEEIGEEFFLSEKLQSYLINRSGTKDKNQQVCL
jgi:hypothetical protein